MPSPYVSNYGITTVTASTTLTAAAHAGQTIVVNAAAGATITLPDATGSGNRYDITTIADQTGDLVIAVPDADNTMQGVAYLGNDAAGASCFYTADTSDTVTLNGTTTGGLKGARVELVDVAANTWNVMVYSEASGTEATPFSAAVS